LHSYYALALALSRTHTLTCTHPHRPSARWGQLQDAFVNGGNNNNNNSPYGLQMNNSNGMGLHLGGGYEFPGRIVPGQRFCLVSFPGEYEEDWKLITGGFVGGQGQGSGGGGGGEGQADDGSTHTGSTAHYPQLSVACVFFPDEKRDVNNGAVIEGTGSHFSGKHGLHDVAGCHCAHIYAKHPSFKEWKDGKVCQALV
jgi:hypothetical protein